jgi:hypothetical protein
MFLARVRETLYCENIDISSHTTAPPPAALRRTAHGLLLLLLLKQARSPTPEDRADICAILGFYLQVLVPDIATMPTAEASPAAAPALAAAPVAAPAAA